jgi:hypothetical protein
MLFFILLINSFTFSKPYLEDNDEFLYYVAIDGKNSNECITIEDPCLF